MARAKLELTPELEAKLIEAWHSKNTRFQICRELDISEHQLDGAWPRLRGQGKIPNTRRIGHSGRNPGDNVKGLRMPSMEQLHSMEKQEQLNRQEACDMLLERLRWNHGCIEACCGRWDIPPALLKTQRDARGIRRSHS